MKKPEDSNDELNWKLDNRIVLVGNYCLDNTLFRNAERLYKLLEAVCSSCQQDLTSVVRRHLRGIALGQRYVQVVPQKIHIGFDELLSLVW